MIEYTCGSNVRSITASCSIYDPSQHGEETLVKPQQLLVRLSALALVSVWSVVSVPLIGQAPGAGSSIPRTPWGDPDLQGDWNAGYLLTPLERPARFAGREFLTDEEVAQLEREQATNPGRNKRSEKGSVADVEGAYNDAFTGRGTKVVRTKRTSLVVDPPDGRIPFTPEGQKRRPVRVVDPEAGPAGIADHPEDRRNDRCLGFTIPVDFGSAATSGGFVRVVQGQGVVTIFYENGHHGGGYRTIPVDGSPHLPPQVRLRLGDARGRWEGNTLVVDTTNFTDTTNYQGSKENLHLVERFTRTSGDELIYRVTISDPTAFTAPWTIEVPYTLSDGRKNQVFESSCHEGNYAMVAILAGARALEKEKAAGANAKQK
jgi:hypothetical protein